MGGTECAAANMAFLKCKAEAQHPRHCLEAGTAVTSCGDGLIARLKSTSGAEFEAFRACLADTNNAFDKCRAQKEALHAVVVAGCWVVGWLQPHSPWKLGRTARSLRRV